MNRLDETRRLLSAYGRGEISDAEVTATIRSLNETAPQESTCIDCGGPSVGTYCDPCNAPIHYSPRELAFEVQKEIEDADIPPAR